MVRFTKIALGDCISTIIDYRGKTPKKLGGDWAIEGYRAISAKNIKTGHIVNKETIRFVDKNLYKIWMKEEIERGDILITSEAPFGEVYYWDSDEKIVLSQRLFAIRCAAGFDPKFIYYYMSSPTFQNELKCRATGTTVIGLRQPELLKCKLLIPDQQTQIKIAKILSSLDNRIELNIRMNKVLEEMARALFHRWFVEFEFPNVDGSPYKSSGGKMVESEMGSVPEGWEVTSLDQIADFMNGIACQKYPPSEDEDSMAVIKIRELRSGNLSEADRVSPSVPEKYHIKNGDVLFSWSGSLMVAIWCSGSGILNQHLFKVSSDIYPKWFYYFWTTHHLQEFQMIAADKATTMGHIKRHHLTDAKVAVPSPDVLIRMDEMISPLISQIIQNCLEINTLTELRDSLLPKLISGKLSVSSQSANNDRAGGSK